MEIYFSDVCEIRMGSPYNHATLELTGDLNTGLNGTNGWQDKYSWTRDREYVALVKWVHKNNEPAFEVVVISTTDGSTSTSNPIKGCCHSIRMSNDLKVTLSVFRQLETTEAKYGLVTEEIEIINMHHNKS